MLLLRITNSPKSELGPRSEKGCHKVSYPAGEPQETRAGLGISKPTYVVVEETFDAYNPFMQLPIFLTMYEWSVSSKLESIKPKLASYPWLRIGINGSTGPIRPADSPTSTSFQILS